MKSRVVAAGPLPSRSAVRTPEASAVETARSSVRPAACSPSPSESISAAASSIPLGLATPCPAMSGAEPCVGPKMPGPDWDSRPEATIREPLRLAAVRSETSSACAFWVTTTQKPSGAFISRGSASLSESRSTSTPGWRSASQPTNVLQVGPSPTAATFALRERARSNARRTTYGSSWSSSGLTTAMSPSGSRTRWTRQVRSSSDLTPSSAGSFVSATRTASARRQAARVSAGSGWP